MPKQENIFTISYALAGYSQQKLASQIANFKNEWCQNINKIIFSEVFNNFVNSLSTWYFKFRFELTCSHKFDLSDIFFNELFMPGCSDLIARAHSCHLLPIQCSPLS